jgi:hypothetical protein
MQVINRRNVIIFILILLVCITGLVLIFNRSGSVTITSGQGNEIYITPEQGGSFEKIGTRTATYKTKKIPSTVYIMISQGDKKTLSSFYIDKRVGHSINLTLDNLVPAQEVTKGSVFNAFYDGSLIQGIVPGEDTLTSFRTDRYETTRPGFAGLPYIEKVVWFDKDNFVYLSDGAVGQFINGVDRGKSGVDAILSASANFEDTEGYDESDFPDVRDISKSSTKPLALMTDKSIFLTDDRAATLREIVKLDQNTRENSLFTSDQTIFRVSSKQAGDAGEEDRNTEPPIIITRYGYSGKELGSLTLDDESPVANIAQNGEETYILTAAALYIARGNDTPKKLGVYFGSSRDMVLYKGRVLVLGDDGLWRLSVDTMSLQLLNKFPEGSVGLAGSMSVTADNRLLFGTVSKQDSEVNTSATFITTF